MFLDGANARGLCVYETVHAQRRTKSSKTESHFLHEMTLRIVVFFIRLQVVATNTSVRSVSCLADV